MKSISILLAVVAVTSATVYFSEKFDKGWESRWVESETKKSEGTQGEFKWTAGKYFSTDNEEEEKGIQTSPDARFYQISAALPTEFSNKGKDLILQYSVKHEQNIDCGGGYIKLLPGGLNQKAFGGDSTYNLMFGPDICGSTKKTHFIITKDGTNHLVKREIRTESDEKTHLYTLTIHPDNTYQVDIDGKEAQKGSLKDDFEILKPKTIKDPAASKPADWVDEKTIVDPEDKKPEGYDDIPESIADPEATKPEDWDDELDGEWERPTIPNPDFKGEWSAKKIPNPLYKGEWEHPEIANPEYVDRDDLYLFDAPAAFVGFELWQVKAGTIFDNIIVTDDAKEAAKLAELTYTAQKGEKAAQDKDEAEKAAAAKAEEEKKAAEAPADSEDTPASTEASADKDEL